MRGPSDSDLSLRDPEDRERHTGDRDTVNIAGYQCACGTRYVLSEGATDADRAQFDTDCDDHDTYCPTAQYGPTDDADLRHIAAVTDRVLAAILPIPPAVAEYAALSAPALRDAALAWRAVDRAEIFTPAWWDATEALRTVVDRIDGFGVRS